MSALAVETAGWREGWGDAGVWVRAGTARLAGRPFTRLLEMVSPDLGSERKKMRANMSFSIASLSRNQQKLYFNGGGVF